MGSLCSRTLYKSARRTRSARNPSRRIAAEKEEGSAVMLSILFGVTESVVVVLAVRGASSSNVTVARLVGS